jgi:cytochrome bd-type quinol oxidase subunit 2
MQDGPSTLSLVAAAFYLLAAVAAIFASQSAHSHRQQAWHMRCWAGVAAFFVLLAVSRAFNIEETLRADLRDWLKAEDLRQGRRSYQGVLIAIAIAACAAIGLYCTYLMARRISGRRNIAVAVAVVSSGAMTALIAMRLISLHAMDVLLFGPLKLNWIGDLGSTAAAMGAAAYYVLLLKGRIGSRR